ncbi:MAG: STAS domain-containing protein [Actinobacteria bacterium]|nr:STAS domain-containing protein [Actinomycetota bacterium]
MEDDRFSFRIRASKGHLIITTAGDLDIYSVEQLDKTLDDWLVAPYKAITIDCEKVDFVDSSFLRYLVALKKRSDNVRVINASRTVLRILQISGFDKIFVGRTS